MEAKELKAIVKLKGLKQRWIADKLKVSDALVSQWIKGEREISSSHKIELSKLLN